MTEERAEGDRRSWSSRPVLAAGLRVLVGTVPIAVSATTVAASSRLLHRSAGGPSMVAWWLLHLLLGTLVLVAADRTARRLLPLAALLRLSLVFPDAAPSRFAVALRHGNLRQVADDDDAAFVGLAPGDAAAATAELARLVGLLHAHDRRTRGHAERVRAYAKLIGVEMGLPDADVNRLQWAGLLHDIGKLEVPGAILNKPGKLTKEEFDVIKRHPAAGEAFVEPLRWWLGDWVDAVGQHHEKFDGGGYPRGLAGTDISLAGRIMAVADAFDVMTAARSYKKPQAPAAARAEVTRCAGTHFDPAVVRAFLSISLGGLRRAMGPLSWLTNVPVLGSAAIAAPSATIGSVSSAVASTVASTAVGVGVTIGVAAGVPASGPPPAFLAATDLGGAAIADGPVGAHDNVGPTGAAVVATRSAPGGTTGPRVGATAGTPPASSNSSGSTSTTGRPLGAAATTTQPDRP